MQKIEYASGATAVWCSCMAIVGQLLGWVSANATLCGLFIAFMGLLIQAFAASHTRHLREAEDQRRNEEHLIKMQIMRGEIPDRRMLPEVE